MPQPTADDPVKADPKHYKVEGENDRVRVLRIKYGAGEKSVMHSHPETIAVLLTDARGKFTYPEQQNQPGFISRPIEIMPERVEVVLCQRTERGLTR